MKKFKDFNQVNEEYIGEQEYINKLNDRVDSIVFFLKKYKKDLRNNKFNQDTYTKVNTVWDYLINDKPIK